MSQVKGTFTNTVMNETGIEVYRDISNTSAIGTLVAALPPDSTLFIDSPPGPGLWYYRARPVNANASPQENGAYTAWVGIAVTTMTGTLGAITLSQIS